MSFQCTIVTPEAQTFDQPVKQVILPAHDGQMGILTNRAPLLAKLGIGPLQVDLTDGKSMYFFVEGGVAQMKDNKLTLLTHQAIPAEAIKPEDARAELAKAESLPADTTEAMAKKADALKRAHTKVDLAGK